MKYTVKFSCGHTETTQLFGAYKDRERKIAWYEESGLCSACYQAKKEAENSEGCREVEMFYGEYKNNYADCKTKAGSYNAVKKTIVVYVPVEPEDENEEPATETESTEEIAVNETTETAEANAPEAAAEDAPIRIRRLKKYATIQHVILNNEKVIGTIGQAWELMQHGAVSNDFTVKARRYKVCPLDTWMYLPNDDVEVVEEFATLDEAKARAMKY